MNSRTEQRVYNFNAGPSVLPESVLQRVAETLTCLPGPGVSILELGHRTSWFKAILQETLGRLRRLLEIDDQYEVFFVQGGGRFLFSVLPMNFCQPGQTADYLVTGSWGQSAYEESQRAGVGQVVWDGRASGYCRLPSQHDWQPTATAAYLHYTSNETIEGVQFPAALDEWLPAPATLVCDMSSDLLSRPVAVSRYALIYACIQKNLGPAGATVVIARRDFLERAAESVPGYCRLLNHAQADSMYNTPPTFCIYVANLVLEWLENEFGDLQGMEAFNRQKAELVYEALEAFPELYQLHAERKARSMVNVTFRLPTPDQEVRFLQEAERAGLTCLAGHRSVGGLRASLYNAMPMAGARALADFVRGFAQG